MCAHHGIIDKHTERRHSRERSDARGTASMTTSPLLACSCAARESTDAASPAPHHADSGANVPTFDNYDAMMNRLKKLSDDIELCNFRMPAFDRVDALAVAHSMEDDDPFVVVHGAIGDDPAAALVRANGRDVVLKSRLSRLSPLVKRELRQSAERRARRRADESARSEALESRLRQTLLTEVLNALPAHIAVLDPTGRIAVVNRAWRTFAEINGLDDGNAGPGAHYLAVCEAAADAGDTTAQQAVAGIRAVLAGTRSDFSLDYPCHAPEVQRWYRMLAAPVGHGLGAVVAHVDITEQVATEHARSLWKQQFQGVVGNVPGYVFRRVRQASGDNRYTYISPSAERLFGVPVDAIVADPAVFWDRIESGDRKKLADAYEQSARDLTSIAIDYRVDRGEGRWFWIRAMARPTRLADGEVVWDGIGLDIDDQKAAEERLRELACQDALTGCANRRFFEDQVDQAAAVAERHGRGMAVHIVDLDHFKEINDTLGHVAGDLLLQSVADRLRGIIRKADTLARLGGDEFGILQIDIESPQDAAILADKINHALATPFDIDGGDVRVTSSIGIDVFPSGNTAAVKNGGAGQQFMRRADLALFEAKRAGRSMYHFFSTEIDDRTRGRMQMRQALHQALEREEFHLLYQPQIDLATGETVGVEALIRWQSPERGMVTPDDFIPLAEETGLIVPIGAWVLREACRQAKAWDAAGLAPLTMAVNVSAEQLLRDGFLEALENALAESGLPPERLDLEVTETSLMADTEILLDRLAKLKAFGVNITIDDFGTGYSSFVYLKRLPAMKIKIDRVFVAGADRSATDRALIGAMVTMADSLGLDLVAEGIETDTQAAVIRELGCRKAQGYLYARPLAPDAVAQFVAGDTAAAG